MPVGATDFVGKPFGKDNPLEDKIREALRAHLQNGDAQTTTPAKLAKFGGGDLVFYDDRIELRGVKVCGAKGSSIKRRVLDLLRERTPKGDFRCFPMKEIADRLKLDRASAVAEAIADLRKECRDRLRDEAAFACEDKDVIGNQNRGYHLRDWITVLDGLDQIEEAAVKMRFNLSENQKGIVRLLRKHGKRTPHQLSDGLDLLRNIVSTEVESLCVAGLVLTEGNGANKTIRLPESAP